MHCSRIREEFWTYCEGECKEDHELGGVLFYQPKVLFEIPLAPQLSPVVIISRDAQLMKEWAHTFGAAVRQRTVRQETTMARAGTFPSFLYQREIMPGESVDHIGKVHRSEDEDGYETCSSAEEEIDEEDGSQEGEANFLLGECLHSAVLSG